MKRSLSPSGPLPKRAFALILSLGLMALMVLLAITLTALIQTESESSTQQRNLMLARQNALMGAYQAIGILQQELGPDQRVTARADMDGNASLSNPYWVGVWDTSSISSTSAFTAASLATTPKRWLVSMPATGSLSSMTPATVPTSSAFVTVHRAVSGQGRTGSLANPVTAFRVEIASRDRSGGGYAWWVADEGMKASLQVENVLGADDAQTLNQLTQAQRRARLQLAPARLGAEALAESANGWASDLAQLTQEEELRLTHAAASAQLTAVSSRLFTQERAAQLAHDITALSCGVLSGTITADGANTLKADLSTATTAVGALGESSPGILAFLNAYRSKVQLNGQDAFPIAATVPDDGNSPQVGKAYFSIAPVVSEWYFSAAIYPKFGSISQINGAALCPGVHLTNPLQQIAQGLVSNPARVPNSQNLPAGAAGLSGGKYAPAMGECLYHPYDESDARKIKMGLEARIFPWFELWNPYTVGLVPKDGHLQLRLKAMPRIRLHYWYNSAVERFTDPYGESAAVWKPNTVQSPDGMSDWLSFHELLNSSYSSADYMGVHLLKQGSTSANAVVYGGGDMLYWFGMRPSRKAVNPIDNDGTLNGDEYAAGYGAARTSFFETNRALTYSYYQAFGAQLTASWRRAADVGKVRFPIYPTGSSAPTSPTDSSDASRWIRSTASERYSRYTAVSVEFEAGQPEVELWWVPDGGGSAILGDIARAVRLSSMKMPVNAVGGEKPTDGEVRAEKYRVEYLLERFGFHYLRLDASQSNADATGRNLNDWLSIADPRAFDQPAKAFDFPNGDNEPGNYHAQSSGGVVSTIPDAASQTAQLLNRDDGRLNGGMPLTSTQAASYILDVLGGPTLTSTGSTNIRHKVPLFEVPTTAPISLGVLQHVCLNGRRPYCIGNSWGRQAGVGGANVNTVFDRAYLSGFPSADLSAADPSAPLTQSNLIPLWRNGQEPPVAVNGELLSYFLSRGAFNVNSTSKDAWRGVLSGLTLRDWQYTLLEDKGGDDTPWSRSRASIPLRRAFARFAHTADETFTAPDNDGGMGVIPSKYYRRGIRRMSNVQIDAMAEIIVRKLKERGRPYASMAEFLSASVTDDAQNGPSLLEYALNPEDSADKALYERSGGKPLYEWTADEVAEEGSSVGGDASGEIDKGAPADISQADILNTLAPLLQVRSDTFKIRSYGDVRDASGQTVARALCEVTVQRLPDPVVSPSDPARRKRPGELGRTFKVTSLQWLNEP